MTPFTALKNFSPFHLVSLYIYLLLLFFFFHFSYQPFTSLYVAIPIYNLHPFTSFAFTFYFLSPSLPPLFCTFLTLVLKILVLPWEVPIAHSGSWFQSVIDLFTNEYFPMSVLCFLALIFQWWSTLLILRWFLDFWKIWAPLPVTVPTYCTELATAIQNHVTVQSPVVTLCTARFDLKNPAFCPHCVFTFPNTALTDWLLTPE